MNVIDAQTKFYQKREEARHEDNINWNHAFSEYTKAGYPMKVAVAEANAFMVSMRINHAGGEVVKLMKRRR